MRPRPPLQKYHVIILKLLSRLPLRVLYALTDILYLVIYHIWRFRRDLSVGNVRNSFPDKATAEVTTAPNVQQVWSQSTIDLIEQYKDALERADRRQDDLEKRLDNVMEELGEVRRGNAAILQHIATLEGIIRKLGVEPPERPIVSRAKKHPPETAHEAKA